MRCIESTHDHSVRKKHTGVARYSLFTIAQCGRISNEQDSERGLI